MTALAPAVELEIKIDSEGSILKIRAENKGRLQTLTARGNVTSTNLKNISDNLKNDLEEFRKNLRGFDAAATALVRLHKRGRAVLHNLFDSDLNLLGEAENLFRSACPEWAAYKLGADRPPPRLILVKTKASYGIPFDILPFFGVGRPGIPGNMDELGRLASQFLGFSAIVRRELGPAPRNPARLDNYDKLPVKFFRHAWLTTVDREEQFFHSKLAIKLDGPWPKAKLTGSFTMQLAQLMLSGPPQLTSNGGRSRSDQILHFSCHCDTTNRNAESYEIRLAYGNEIFGKEYSAPLSELKDALIEIIREHGTTHGPLIFLNACGSASVDPSTAGSFPDLFTNPHFGFLGFIGTEVEMPDAFASAFTCEFYSALLSGLSLGSALYEARWNLVRERKNPLGLMYSLYADPEIRVRRPA